MKKSIIIVIVLIFGFSVNAQDILGKWKTIDDETGEAKSIVQIYKKDGKVFGKIIEIFNKERRDLPCVKCKGDDYNKPILGLDIIKSMTKDGKYFKNGTIVDPQNGKEYDLRLIVTDEGKLQVRGYIGFFYSTQYWERIQ
ncbi:MULTISPECIES: DUF2147 domain-containing protein [Olleya]|jgi:uncharacterized protein (DUF2147 family)|uniref:DUF2147 domain-containing protein n=1 Tax=Olleya marilimosa TaxID=272164 RepID=A0ABR8LR68_9FLAO|nr:MULTISPECIES: DUF2147 domain-containing protein [Olleya]MBD3862345.1 DUF2147 domain-containing protein [Olleya marilimosa]MBD3889843.1 DUF2147 domain-containing protein [Olleya marilimosa]TVZ46959.1 uncharacterized protein DUF2147 [Olleya sp. Hel_I_94]|tara:strand:- start:77399 stop:77818 length:420 start_codon:yes stop_codon:yes gene_type:complete